MNTTDIEGLRQTRANDPNAVVEAAAARKTRARGDRLMLVAADHPARGVVSVGDNPTAMADRAELLSRLVTVLGHPNVDGVLGTADILEDLLLLGALENKIVIGSMNRGGLAGSSFELDDRFTAYDASTIAQMRFDGGKMLLRIGLDDPGTSPTMEASARAISELAHMGLAAMVEPFLTRWVDGRVRSDLSPNAVIRSITIASGLGTTSRHMWLKLPVVEEMDRVTRATTLPILLLGGDPSGPADELYDRWEKALALSGVRGLVVGRALLYPEDDDVSAAVELAATLVHG